MLGRPSRHDISSLMGIQAQETGRDHLQDFFSEGFHGHPRIQGVSRA